MSNHGKFYALFFILLLTLVSCASTRMNPLLSQDSDTSPPSMEITALSKNTPKLWLMRDHPESLFQFIGENEKVAKSSLGTQGHCILQARAYYLLGEYFSKTNEDRAVNWENASNWAEKALTFNADFKDALLKKKLPPELAIDVLTKKDVDALYWFAASLGRWVSTQGISSELKYKDRIKKMIDRVAKLSPNYLYGAVYRYYGVYYALLPEFEEEDLKNSRKNFEKAVKRFPEYFGNHVLYAQYYAKKIDDQALFKRQLEIVIKGNPHLLKDFYPEQVLEQARAKSLLEGTPSP
jgi:tetratricopeptide (TPR) repeat protein